jgi:hypothetical protein
MRPLEFVYQRWGFERALHTDKQTIPGGKTPRFFKET